MTDKTPNVGEKMERYVERLLENTGGVRNLNRFRGGDHRGNPDFCFKYEGARINLEVTSINYSDTLRKRANFLEYLRDKIIEKRDKAWDEKAIKVLFVSLPYEVFRLTSLSHNGELVLKGKKGDRKELMLKVNLDSELEGGEWNLIYEVPPFRILRKKLFNLLNSMNPLLEATIVYNEQKIIIIGKESLNPTTKSFLTSFGRTSEKIEPNKY